MTTGQKTQTIENLYEPNCIRTVSGQYVNLIDPNPDTILIEDIAHALSNIPRFGGHLPISYTVADHCILCAARAETKHKFAALMHDASEAYLMDIPSPVKKLIPEYKIIEDRLMRVISGKFGFEYPLHDYVKKIDKYVLIWEWDALMLNNQQYHSPYNFLDAYRYLHNNTK